MKDESGEKGDKLVALKTRTKVLIVAAGVAVALLVGRSMLQRPVPYRFLAAAEYQGTEIEDFMAGFNPPMPPRPETVQEYRIAKAWERVVEQAELELTNESGWTRDPEPGAAVFRRGDESIVVLLDEKRFVGERDIVRISVFRPAGPLDRVAPLIQYQLRLAKRRQGRD